MNIEFEGLKNNSFQNKTSMFLNKIEKFVRLLIFINATENFIDPYEVANSASEFLIEYFGEKGKCAMTVAGMDSVFSNIPVEIELILELKN